MDIAFVSSTLSKDQPETLHITQVNIYTYVYIRLAPKPTIYRQSKQQAVCVVNSIRCRFRFMQSDRYKEVWVCVLSQSGRVKTQLKRDFPLLSPIWWCVACVARAAPWQNGAVQYSRFRLCRLCRDSFNSSCSAHGRFCWRHSLAFVDAASRTNTTNAKNKSDVGCGK